MALKRMEVRKRHFRDGGIITAYDIRKGIDPDLSFYAPAHPASTSFVRDRYASATLPFGSCLKMLTPIAEDSDARTESGMLFLKKRIRPP